jgi:hypothetical protein
MSIMQHHPLQMTLILDSMTGTFSSNQNRFVAVFLGTLCWCVNSFKRVKKTKLYVSFESIYEALNNPVVQKILQIMECILGEQEKFKQFILVTQYLSEDTSESADIPDVSPALWDIVLGSNTENQEFVLLNTQITSQIQEPTQPSKIWTSWLCVTTV